MKKRRTLIISLLLVAALCLGIGYAAVSRELEVTGTAQYQPDNANFDINFTKSTTSDETHSTHGFTEDVGTFAVSGLTKKDDTVKFTFTITNETSDITAKIASAQDVTITDYAIYLGSGTTSPVDPANEDDYITVDTVIKDQNGEVWDYATDSLAPNESLTIEVTVVLQRTATEIISLSGYEVYIDFTGEN